MLERTIKSAMALGWYVREIVVPLELVAFVEFDATFYRCDSSFASWLWSTLVLVAVPYVALVILTDSMETSTRKAVACTYGTVVGLLFPKFVPTCAKGDVGRRSMCIHAIAR